MNANEIRNQLRTELAEMLCDREPSVSNQQAAEAMLCGSIDAWYAALCGNVETLRMSQDIDPCYTARIANMCIELIAHELKSLLQKTMSRN